MNTIELNESIEISKNYLKKNSDLNANESNALTFLFLSRYSEIYGEPLEEDDYFKMMTDGANDKGIDAIYINDIYREKCVQICLIQTKYVSNESSYSVDEKEVFRIIKRFNEFPNIKGCNSKVNDWQEQTNRLIESNYEIEKNILY